MGELKGLYCECFGDNRPCCLEAEMIFFCHDVSGGWGLPWFHGEVHVQTSGRWRVQTLVTWDDLVTWDNLLDVVYPGTRNPAAVRRHLSWLRWANLVLCQVVVVISMGTDSRMEIFPCQSSSTANCCYLHRPTENKMVNCITVSVCDSEIGTQATGVNHPEGTQPNGTEIAVLMADSPQKGLPPLWVDTGITATINWSKR